MFDGSYRTDRKTSNGKGVGMKNMKGNDATQEEIDGAKRAGADWGKYLKAHFIDSECEKVKLGCNIKFEKVGDYEILLAKSWCFENDLISFYSSVTSKHYVKKFNDPKTDEVEFNTPEEAILNAYQNRDTL